MAQHYLVYATANDVPSYRLDLKHFENMARFDPGVDRVTVDCVVSLVNPKRRSDDRLAEKLSARLSGQSKVRLSNCHFKSNVGRDMSSFAFGLRTVLSNADDDDTIMFLNRSAYGPFKIDWYRAYLRGLVEAEGAGLCGNTINFRGYPGHENAERYYTHIQSYVLVGKAGTLRHLETTFPGEFETDRLGVITNGEIGISRHIMEAGYGITCLAWPGRIFTRERPFANDLPNRDVKWDVENLPFLHRKPGYDTGPRTAADLYAGIKPKLIRGITKIQTRLLGKV